MNVRYNKQYNMPRVLPDGELQRRHDRLQKVMKAENLAAALVFSSDGVFKTWLLGQYVQGYACVGDILTVDGPGYIVGEEFLVFRYLEDGESIDDCSTPTDIDSLKRSVSFSYAPIGAAVARTGSRRIGLYHPEEMSIDAWEYMKKHLPDAEYVDVTEKFDAVRMEKSTAEIELSVKSLASLERVFAAIPALLEPGITEFECANRIRNLQNEGLTGDLNSHMRKKVWLVSNPDGEALSPEPLTYPGRYLRYGDRVDVTVHSPALEWVHAAMARSFVMADEVSDETRRKWDIAVKATRLAAEMLRPGETLGNIASRVSGFLAGNGCREDGSVFLYAVYYGMMEQPCLADKSRDMPLRENSIIAVFPRAIFGGEAPMCCGDMYLVTPEGGKRLGSLTQDILPVKGLWNF